MKFSSAVIKSVSLSVAIFLSLTSTLSAIAQSEAGAAARDYSFTISATQPWTDTGVDLQAGDTLEISAKARAGDSCDPEGTKAATPAAGATPSLLVATAPAGALIAKLQEQGQAVLVGSVEQLKADQPGHLFFGTNGVGTNGVGTNGAGPNGAATPACSFSVKVHVANTGSAPQAAVPAKALTPATSSATPTTATPAAQPTGQTRQRSNKDGYATGHQIETRRCRPGFSGRTIRYRSAREFFVGPSQRGSFPDFSHGHDRNTSDSGIDNLHRRSGFGLKKNIDGLPRRVNDQFNNQGDMVNFVSGRFPGAGPERPSGCELALGRYRQ